MRRWQGHSSRGDCRAGQDAYVDGMDRAEAIPDRRIVALTGEGALPFLQGLVTADVMPLAQGPGLVWTALLSPQGKYLADFFVAETGAGLLLDLPEALAEDVLRRLAAYRLRARVGFEPSPLHPVRGLGPDPADALPDPRHPALGWRAWRAAPGAPGAIDWAALAVDHLVPQTGDDLVPGESYILEYGFDRLGGVDFRKGCYVGQEVTARMRHKTELRKGLVRVTLPAPLPPGTLPPGTPVVTAEGREAGRLGTRAGERALAWLRFDRLAGPLSAAGLPVTADPESLPPAALAAVAAPPETCQTMPEDT
jgi:hypothetical protein